MYNWILNLAIGIHTIIGVTIELLVHLKEFIEGGPSQNGTALDILVAQEMSIRSVLVLDWYMPMYSFIIYIIHG